MLVCVTLGASCLRCLFHLVTVILKPLRFCIFAITSLFLLTANLFLSVVCWCSTTISPENNVWLLKYHVKGFSHRSMMGNYLHVLYQSSTEKVFMADFLLHVTLNHLEVFIAFTAALCLDKATWEHSSLWIQNSDPVCTCYTNLKAKSVALSSLWSLYCLSFSKTTLFYLDCCLEYLFTYYCICYLLLFLDPCLSILKPKMHPSFATAYLQAAVSSTLAT